MWRGVGVCRARLAGLQLMRSIDAILVNKVRNDVVYAQGKEARGVGGQLFLAEQLHP